MKQTEGGSKYERIWKAVQKIPRGRVMTYGAVAEMCGLSGQPRVIGYALHNLHPGMDVAWHRVINAQGKVSLPGNSGRIQRQLLESEGVAFARDRIDLSVYGWRVKKKATAAPSKKRRPGISGPL